MSSICELKEWRPGNEITLYKAICSEPGWLAYTHENGETVLYFGRGMIKLQFSAKGALFNIFLSDGYAGTLWGNVMVGSPLSMVQQQCPLEYDGGDEMHYPTAESAVVGVAFDAEEWSLDEAQDQLISGISVHNWSMSN